MLKKMFMEPFLEVHNKEIFGAKHFKSVKIYRADEMLVQNVCLVHKTLQFDDFR